MEGYVQGGSLPLTALNAGFLDFGPVDLWPGGSLFWGLSCVLQGVQQHPWTLPLDVSQ